MGLYGTGKTLWGSIELYSILQDPMGGGGVYGVQWGSGKFYGALWGSMGSHKVLWDSTRLKGFYEVP